MSTITPYRTPVVVYYNTVTGFSQQTGFPPMRLCVHCDAWIRGDEIHVGLTDHCDHRCHLDCLRAFLEANGSKCMDCQAPAGLTKVATSWIWMTSEVKFDTLTRFTIYFAQSNTRSTCVGCRRNISRAQGYTTFDCCGSCCHMDCLRSYILRSTARCCHCYRGIGETRLHPSSNQSASRRVRDPPSFHQANAISASQRARSIPDVSADRHTSNFSSLEETVQPLIEPLQTLEIAPVTSTSQTNRQTLSATASTRTPFGQNLNVDAHPDDEVENCPICVKPLGIPLFSCEAGHQFHRYCIEKWVNIGTNRLCPNCRQELDLDDRLHPQDLVILDGIRVTEQKVRDDFLKQLLEDRRSVSTELQVLRHIYKEAEYALYWIYRASLQGSNPSNMEVRQIAEVNEEVKLWNRIHSLEQQVGLLSIEKIQECCSVQSDWIRKTHEYFASNRILLPSPEGWVRAESRHHQTGS